MDEEIFVLMFVGTMTLILFLSTTTKRQMACYISISWIMGLLLHFYASEVDELFLRLLS